MTRTRVAVVGGTGVLGGAVVRALVERGDEVRVISRAASEERLPDGVTAYRADVATGDGLADALAGATVVIDAANSMRAAEQVLVAGTRRLLDTGRAAGVRHHLAISIVGCDRLPLAYYRVKVEQERALAAGPVPWSLLRATQFHQLIDGLFTIAARYRLRPAGQARLQPIDPAVVADRLAEAAHAEPAGRLPDVAGPEVRTLGELGTVWAAARGRRAVPLPIPVAIGPLRALAAGALCDPEAAPGGATFEQWLRHV